MFQLFCNCSKRTAGFVIPSIHMYVDIGNCASFAQPLPMHVKLQTCKLATVLCPHMQTMLPSAETLYDPIIW